MRSAPRQTPRAPRGFRPRGGGGHPLRLLIGGSRKYQYFKGKKCTHISWKMPRFRRKKYSMLGKFLGVSPQNSQQKFGRNFKRPYLSVEFQLKNTKEFESCGLKGKKKDTSGSCTQKIGMKMQDLFRIFNKEIVMVAVIAKHTEGKFSAPSKVIRDGSNK